MTFAPPDEEHVGKPEELRQVLEEATAGRPAPAQLEAARQLLELEDGDGSLEPLGAPLLKSWPTHTGHRPPWGFLLLEVPAELDHVEAGGRAPRGLTSGVPSAPRLELGLMLGPLVFRYARYRRTDATRNVPHPYHPDSHPDGLEVPVFRWVGWRAPLATEDPTVQTTHGGGELGRLEPDPRSPTLDSRWLGRPRR